MPYIVTVKNGLVDVVLPNGLRAQGGNTALLTDQQFAALSNTVVATGALSGAAPTYVSSYTATTAVESTLPLAANWTEAMNPAGAGTDVPSTQTTPYSVPTNPSTLEIG